MAEKTHERSFSANPLLQASEVETLDSIKQLFPFGHTTLDPSKLFHI